MSKKNEMPDTNHLRPCALKISVVWVFFSKKNGCFITLLAYTDDDTAFEQEFSIS